MPGKPFVKGDPRINRKGRPPAGDSMAEILRQVGHQEVALTDRLGRKLKPRERRILLAEALWYRAIKDSDPAAKILLNYHDGLPPFRAVIMPEEYEDEPDWDSMPVEQLALVVSALKRTKGPEVEYAGAKNGSRKDGKGKNGGTKAPGSNGSRKP